MTTKPAFSAKAIPTTKRVATSRAGIPVQQTHRGYTGIVYVPGHRQPFRTGTFHQKRKAAQATAEKFGRWLVKDPANIEWALARKAKAMKIRKHQDVEKIEVTMHMRNGQAISMVAVPDEGSTVTWIHVPEYADEVDDLSIIRMVPTGRHDFTLSLEKVRVLNGDEETR